MKHERALITGASSGIGRALSLWFAQRGTKVWAAARRKAELEALQKEAGENIVPVVLDVSDADAAEAKVRALDADAKFDLLVANAGVGVESYGKRIDWPPIKRMLEVNVIGATATICGVLPGTHMPNRAWALPVASEASRCQRVKRHALGAAGKKRLRHTGSAEDALQGSNVEVFARVLGDPVEARLSIARQRREPERRAPDRRGRRRGQRGVVSHRSRAIER